MIKRKKTLENQNQESTSLNLTKGINKNAIGNFREKYKVLLHEMRIEPKIPTATPPGIIPVQACVINQENTRIIKVKKFADNMTMYTPNPEESANSQNERNLAKSQNAKSICKKKNQSINQSGVSK